MLKTHKAVTKAMPGEAELRILDRYASQAVRGLLAAGHPADDPAAVAAKGFAVAEAMLEYRFNSL